MEQNKQYVVAIRGFRPPDTLKNASAHPILTFQIGDLIKMTSKVNADWAFGRLLNSADSALFPLRFTRPIKSTDELETATLNLTNVWWEKTKQEYAAGLSEKDIDEKLNLISKLTSTLKCQQDSESPKNLPAVMEAGCDSFAMDLHPMDKHGQTVCVNNIEFNELIQLVKQKRLKLSRKQTIGSSLQDLASTTIDHEHTSVLLIRINLDFAQLPKQLDSELMITFVRKDSHLPCYESYRVADLLNPKPIYLLLEAFDSKPTNQLHIKIDSFMQKVQALPNKDIQHEMMCFKNTTYSPLIASKPAFTKTIELSLPTDDGNTKLVANLCMHGELLMHKNRDQLEMELKQRQINAYQVLFPLNAKLSPLTTTEKDRIYLTFDFANLPLLDTQSDRLQLIVCAKNLQGDIIKDVFVDSIVCDIPGIPMEKNLTSKNYLQYFLFGLKDQFKLHLEINLPKHVGSNLHLHLLFYSSTSDGRLIGNTPVAVAFIRLLDNELLIGMGATEILLYKVDSMESVDRLNYLKYAATKRERRLYAMETEVPHASAPVHISTSSTNFTPDQHVLALLKCNNKQAIEDAIKQLSDIASDFSLFLPRFLPNLFNKLGTDNEFDRKVFGFINVLFKRSEYPNEHNLKKVLDSQLVSLTNPRVYGPFFALLNAFILPNNLPDANATFRIDTMRGCPKMAKIIIVSASSDPQLINYKQGDTVNNFVLQHLNSKFTLLLNTIISTLRNKSIQLADHQWTQLNLLPEMIDVLLQHEVFDSHSLALFLIDLVRVVPAKLQMAQMEIIRSATKTRLFKEDNVRRSMLMPEFMPLIVQALCTVSSKPVESSKLLHSTVSLLLNILHLIRTPLHESGDQKTRNELLSLTTNCLLPIIRCCNNIYSGRGDIEMLSQTAFVTLIDLIDAQVFADYLETFENESQISDMLAEFLKALRPFTEYSTIPEFNEQPVKLALYQQCKKYFQLIKCAIFDNRTFYEFQIAVWKELTHAIYSFLMSSNDSRLSLHSEQISTLRLASVECFRSMWFSLSANKKLALGRNTFEFVLDLLSNVQSQRLNSILLAMFGDILKTEGYHYIDLTSQHSDRPFTVYKLLHKKLMKRPTNLATRNTLCTELEKELRSVVLCDKKFACVKKLNMLPRFLKLINYGREALFRDNPFEIGLIYYKFLDFWYETNEKEMALEYILRLYSFHKNQNELIEAAFSLQNYALHLNWANDADAPELVPLSKCLKFDVTNESQIKERLFWHVSELFGSADAWELAIPILKELALHYETIKLDYEQLGNAMDKLRENYHLIGRKLRLNCLYFVVSFYGSQQPEYLRNKKFVFRGKPVEMLDSFRQRIVLNFGCELLQSLDEDPQKLLTLSGRYATVASVQPVPSSEHLRLSVAENPLVAFFYKHNFMNKFLMTRPVHKKETKWTAKFGLTDTTKTWIKCTEFNLNQTLPGILPFREVFLEREMEHLNPLQFACMTLTNTNEELSVNARLVSHGFAETYLKAFLGQLRGILQAFVGGGIKNYEMFLSDEVDSFLINEEMLAEKERLKQLLIEQVKLLDYGLCVHSEHLDETSKLLHNTLLDSFNDYRQKIQQLCGVECIASLSRKASIAVLETDTHRKHSKYLSRLSTDSSTMFNADSKPALQQRSMSTTCPSDSHGCLTQTKKKLAKTDALPLPPRRSNRHSSKLLKS